MSELNYEYHSFEELVDIADKKHNIHHESSTSEAADILKIHPYYSLVNGYQRALETEENSEKFRDNLSLEYLAQIHTYETILSSNLLRTLLSFETNIKNILQDIISKEFGICEDDYLNTSLYRNNNSNPNRTKVTERLTNIARYKSKVTRSLLKYRENGNVPPWILVNDLTFGELKNWYQILPVELKKVLLNEFNYFNMPEDMFLEFFRISLDILNDFRNGLAHGDILNKIIIRDSVHYHHLSHAFSSSVISQQEFNVQHVGKNDLYGAVLILFMLAPTNYKQLMHVQLKNDLILFDSLIKLDSSQARRLLGIPDNILDRLDKIKEDLFEHI